MHPLNDPNNVNALPDTTPILRALNRWRNGMDELATPEEFLAVLAAADSVTHIHYEVTA